MKLIFNRNVMHDRLEVAPMISSVDVTRREIPPGNGRRIIQSCVESQAVPVRTTRGIFRIP